MVNCLIKNSAVDFFFFQKLFHVRSESWGSILADPRFLITLTFITAFASTFCTALRAMGNRGIALVGTNSEVSGEPAEKLWILWRQNDSHSSFFSQYHPDLFSFTHTNTSMHADIHCPPFYNSVGNTIKKLVTIPMSYWIIMTLNK